MAQTLGKLARELKPYIVRWINEAMTGAGGGGATGEMAKHALSGAYHDGTLADSQAPQFLKADGSRNLTGSLSVADGVLIDGVDISAHAADAAAHHDPVTAGDGILIDGQAVSVDEAFAFAWTARHAFGGGLGTNHILFTNHEQPVTPEEGYAYYDRNVADADVGGLGVLQSTSRGGVVLYNADDGWGLLLDTRNMEVVNAAFRSVKATDYVQTPKIQATGDLVLDPAGSDVLPGGTIEDDLGDYNRMWRTLFAAELYVENLVAQDVLATIGGRILVTPTTKLIADCASGASTIDVEHNNLSSGGYIILASAPGGIAQTEVMKITSGATGITGGYRYSVTRNQDGSGANDWVAGDAVAYLGDAVGEGYIELTSTQTVHQHLGPNITIYSRTGTATWNAVKAVVSLGNLESFVDYATPEFGLAVGNDLDLTPTTGFKGLTADRSAGLRLFNTAISLYNGSTQTVDIQPDGDMALGSNVGAVATTSFYHAAAAQTYDSESLGAGDIVIGNHAAGHMFWDRSAGQLQFRGGTDVEAYIDTDGSIVSGNGAVVIDSNGIRLASSSSLIPAFSRLSWGNLAGSIAVYTESGDHDMRIVCGNSTYDGYIWLYSYNPDPYFYGGELKLNKDYAELGIGSYDLRITKSTGIATFGGSLEISGSLTLPNATGIRFLDNSATVRDAMRMTSGDDLVLGLGVQAGNYVALSPDGTSGLRVYSNKVESYEPLLLNGDDTITSAPTAAGTNVGWKMALYGSDWAMGIASYTLALRAASHGWLSLFNGLNPANDGTASAMDSNAVFGVNDTYIQHKGALGEGWITWGTGDMLNNFVHYDSATYHAPGYKKFGDTVWLRGLVGTSSGTGNGLNIVNIPAGYRPGRDVIHPVICSVSGGTGAIGYVRIRTTGAVTFYGDATDWVSLEGVRFSVAS